MSDHRQTDAFKLEVCLFFFFFFTGSQNVALLILCLHVIHHSDHYHHADHHSCIWDTAFHQYGLLTSAPLEINLCILINHTCWCNIHHWWGVDEIAIGSVKRCLVDLVTIHALFHHYCSAEVCVHTPAYIKAGKQHEQFEKVKELEPVTFFWTQKKTHSDSSWLKTEVLCYFHQMRRFAQSHHQCFSNGETSKDSKDRCWNTYTHLN